MAITLTDTAAEHIKNYLDNRGKGKGLRLAVKTTGCSGMAYVLEFVDEADDSDKVFESLGVTIFVDPKKIKLNKIRRYFIPIIPYS